MAGAQHLLDRLPALFGGTVGVLPVLYIGRSEQAPAAMMQQHPVARATSQLVQAIARVKLTRHDPKSYLNHGAYVS